MDKCRAFWILIAAIIISGFGFYFLYNPQIPSGRYDSLASCLTANGAIMYGQEGCHACEYQKKLLGDSFRLVSEIDCKSQPEVCNRQMIVATPTWLINGSLRQGFLTPEELANLSGCAAAA